MRKPTSRVSRVVVHAGMSQKERADRGHHTAQHETRPIPRPDALLSFLEGL